MNNPEGLFTFILISGYPSCDAHFSSDHFYLPAQPLMQARAIQKHFIYVI